MGNVRQAAPVVTGGAIAARAARRLQRVAVDHVRRLCHSVPNCHVSTSTAQQRESGLQMLLGERVIVALCTHRRNG